MVYKSLLFPSLIMGSSARWHVTCPFCYELGWHISQGQLNWLYLHLLLVHSKEEIESLGFTSDGIRRELTVWPYQNAKLKYLFKLLMNK